MIGPELGVTQPGMTIVCGDSHTATHGAFGALAFGIGTSEVEHVLATQTLHQPKPRSMRIRYEVLTPPLPGQRAEVSRHSLQPGAATGGPGDPPMHEPGSRETAIVTNGRVRLVVGEAGYDLHDGDSVTFDADLPHHFENHGKEEAVLLAVVSAGLRRS